MRRHTHGRGGSPVLRTAPLGQVYAFAISEARKHAVLALPVDWVAKQLQLPPATVERRTADIPEDQRETVRQTRDLHMQALCAIVRESATRNRSIPEDVIRAIRVGYHFIREVKETRYFLVLRLVDAHGPFLTANEASAVIREREVATKKARRYLSAARQSVPGSSAYPFDFRCYVISLARKEQGRPGAKSQVSASAPSVVGAIFARLRGGGSRSAKGSRQGHTPRGGRLPLPNFSEPDPAPLPPRTQPDKERRRRERHAASTTAATASAAIHFGPEIGHAGPRASHAAPAPTPVPAARNTHGTRVTPAGEEASPAGSGSDTEDGATAGSGESGGANTGTKVEAETEAEAEAGEAEEEEEAEEEDAEEEETCAGVYSQLALAIEYAEGH